MAVEDIGSGCSSSGDQEFHVLAVDDSIIDRKVIERLLKISCCKGVCVCVFLLCVCVILFWLVAKVALIVICSDCCGQWE